MAENIKSQSKKSKKILIVIITILLIMVATFFCLYKFNPVFKQTINTYVLLNSESDSNVTKINIDKNTINSIIGCKEYFAILKQNNLIGYIGQEEVFSYPILATNVTMYASDKYLVVGEIGGKKIYLFGNDKLVYEKDVGGTISQVTVNKNGYVAVSMKKDGYRSVIVVYNPDGEDIVTTFLYTTYAADMKISDNNKKMAIVEVDTSGIQIASCIKFVQLDKLNESNSVINTQKEVGNIIGDIKFVTNDTLMYLTDNIVKEVNLLGEKKDIVDLSNNNIINVDLKLKNGIVITEKVKDGLFVNSTNIIVVNRENKEIGRYTLDGSIKQLKVYDDIIVANIGQEIYFLNSSCRPIKKYVSNSDIKDIIIYKNNNMAALIYRNNIEIIYI